MRSLGWKVPIDWVAKEVRMKTKLDYDPKVFFIHEDHLILCFLSEIDYIAMLKGSPWFVARQLLAMETWELDFVPGRKMIHKVVVWLRLS